MAKKKSVRKPDATSKKQRAALAKAEARADRWKAKAQKSRAAAAGAEKRVATLEKRVAKLEKRLARVRRDAAPAPTVEPAEGAPDDSWTVARLRAEARARGLEGLSRKTKQQLIDALR